ncbi:hypothetical protein J7643_02455 [bacterium]|nr:hypothetical protein [bacterium]
MPADDRNLPTYLHVLYAGRGDAMIIQDGDKLIMLDGGPMGYVHGSRGAAYYRYLCSAVARINRELRGDVDHVTPDAIIISHPDEDHYGGLVELLQTYLNEDPSARPTWRKNLVFNGPLLLPAIDGSSVVEAALSGHQFTSTPHAGLSGYTLHGPGGISEYRRGGPRRLARDWSVDSSGNNLNSILMAHDATRMVFTGDSIGAAIVPFLESRLAAWQGEPLSIFKVPHHGSLRNSQYRTSIAPTLTESAKADYLLNLILTFAADPTDLEVQRVVRSLGREVLETISAQHGGEGLENAADRLGYPDLGVALHDLGSKLLTESQTILETVIGSAKAAGVELKDEIKALKQAAKTRLDDLEQRIAAVQDDNYQIETSVDGNRSIALIRSFKQKALESEHFYVSRVRFSRHATPVLGSWYKVLMESSAVDFFMGRIVFKELTVFYMSFEAKAYVISANGSYGHPSPETIAAIATAAKERQRQVRLFVTDGKSVKRDSVTRVAGAGWEQYLEIRYLASTASMVLDPAQADSAAIDVYGRTEELPAVAVDLGALHGCLERNFQPLPDRGVPADQYEIQVVGQSDQPLYLGLSSNNLPVVRSRPTPFTISEAHDLGARGFKEIRVTCEAPDAMGDSVAYQSFVFSCEWRDETEFVLVWDPFKGLNPDTYVTTDADNAFRTVDPQNPDIAVFRVNRISPDAAPLLRNAPMPRLLANASVPLRKFFEDAGIAHEGPMTAPDVLRALLGPENATEILRQLQLQDDPQGLDWRVDLDGASVTYEAQGLTVTEAAFALVPPEGATHVSGARVTIAWHDDLIVELIRDPLRASLPQPARFSPLTTYLDSIGIPQDQWTGLRVGNLLTYMLGSRLQAATTLLKLPAFLNEMTSGASELPAWTMDLGRSRIRTFPTITGQREVLQADLTLNAGSLRLPAPMAGLDLSLSNLVLTVTDARLPTLAMALTANASLNGVSLEAVIPMTTDRPSMQLKLPGNATLGDLAGLVPGLSGLEGLGIPMGAGLLGSAANLSDLGFTLAAVTEGTHTYHLTSVSGTLTLDWAAILPAGFPAPTTTTIKFEVFDPLIPEARRVGVGVDFTFAVPESGKQVIAHLAAWPLAGAIQATPSLSAAEEANAYAYTLELRSPLDAPPASLTEVLSAVSYGACLDTLGSTLPLLADVLNAVTLRQARLSLMSGDAGYAFNEVSLDLAIPETWTVIPNVLALQGVELSARYFAEAWSGALSATLLLGTGVAVFGSVKLPSLTERGSFRFVNVQKLSVCGIIHDVLGLPDLSGTPVLGALLSTTLDTFEADLAYRIQAPGEAPQLGLTRATAAFNLDTLSVGPLSLSAVAVSVTYTHADPKAYPGIPFQPFTTFEAEAYLGSSAVATLAYDGQAGTLRGTLRSLGNRSVSDMIAELLGARVPNALLPVIGGMTVTHSNVELDTESLKLRAFTMALAADASLTVGTLAVTRLNLAYRAASDSDAARYQLSGVIQGSNLNAVIVIDCLASDDATAITASISSLSETQRLTLSGVLGLFGLATPDVPDGCPDFLDLEVSTVAATLTRSAASSGFELSALDVLVASSGQLVVLKSPTIALRDLRLNVSYRADAQPTTMGIVSGRLSVAAGEPISGQVPALADLWLAYGRDAEGSFYRGDLALGSGALAYADLLAQFTPAGSIAWPRDLNLPDTMPAARLSIEVRPEQSIELWTYADPTQWEFQLGGQSLSLGLLGGRVRVLAPADAQATAIYEACLYGRLSAGGYVTAEARLWLGSAQNTVITAVVSPDDGVSDPLASLTGQFASADQPAWNTLIPAATAPLQFAGGAFMYLDLTEDVLALFGSVGDLGTGSLLFRPSAAGTSRRYLFSLGLRPDKLLGSLWPSLQEALDATIPLASAGAVVASYEASGAELTQTVQAVSAYAATHDVPFTTPFSGMTLAPDLPVPRGMVLYANLQVADSGALSRLLNHFASKGTLRASVFLVARVDDANRLDLKVEGALTFGGMELNVRLYVVDGAPKVAAATLIADLSILDLFDSVVSGVDWPSDYSPLTFKRGAVYYADLPDGSAATLDGHRYVSGYHLRAEVEIFGKLFLVDAELPADRDGMLLTGTFPGSLDLGLVELTSYSYTDAQGVTHVTPGPTITLDRRKSRQTVYMIQSGLKIFGVDFLQASFAYVSSPIPADRYYLGEAHYQGTLLGIENPQIAFSYSDAKGFRLTNFPAIGDWLDALDFAKELREASKNQPCKELVDLVFDKAIKTSCSVTVAQAEGGEPVSSGSLHLVVSGTYSITVVGKTLVDLPLPELPVVLTKSGDGFTAEALFASIGKSLLESAVEIAEALLAQTDKVSELIAVMAVENYSKELITRLLCRGICPPNVKDRADDFVKKAPDDFWPWFATAAGLAVAAGAFVALKRLVSHYPAAERAKALQQLELVRTEFELAKARLAEKLNFSGKPTSTFVDAKTVKVDLASTKPTIPELTAKEGSYAFELEYSTTADFSASTTLTTTETSVLLQSEAFAFVTQVFVRVKAVFTFFPTAEGGDDVPSEDLIYRSRDWAIADIADHPAQLTPPATVSLARDDDEHWRLTVTQPDARASRIRIEVVDTAHADTVIAGIDVSELPVGEPATALISEEELANAAPGATLVTRARSVGDGQATADSEWVYEATVHETLAAPAGLAARVTDGQLLVTWDAVPEADGGYVLALRDAAGQPLWPDVVQTWKDATTCVLDGPALYNGLSLQIGVRAKSSVKSGVWSRVQQTFELPELPTPGAVEAMYYPDTRLIEVTWESATMPEGVRYWLDVTVMNGDAARVRERETASASPYLLGDVHAADGRRFELCLTAVMLDAAGRRVAASPPTRVSLAPSNFVETPGYLVETLSPGGFTFEWPGTFDDGLTTYELVLAQDGTVLGQKSGLAVKSWGETKLEVPFGLDDDILLIPGQSYEATVRAKREHSYSSPRAHGVQAPDARAFAETFVRWIKPVMEAADALRRYIPQMPPRVMSITLTAGGYPMEEVVAALATRFPAVSSEEWARVREAMGNPLAIATLLLEDGIFGSEAMGLFKALFAGRYPAAECFAFAQLFHASAAPVTEVTEAMRQRGLELPPPLLVAALLAAGYPSSEIAACIGLSEAEWARAAETLVRPAALAALLDDFGVSDDERRWLLASRFGLSTPIAIALVLKAAGRDRASLGADFAPELLSAIYDQPWQLGAFLKEADFPAQSFVTSLGELWLAQASPELTLLEAMAILRGAGYDPGDTGALLRVGRSATADAFADALMLVTNDMIAPPGPGMGLVKALQREGANAESARGYLRSTYPELSDEQVSAAVSAAYDPS